MKKKKRESVAKRRSTARSATVSSSSLRHTSVNDAKANAKAKTLECSLPVATFVTQQQQQQFSSSRSPVQLLLMPSDYVSRPVIVV